MRAWSGIGVAGLVAAAAISPAVAAPVTDPLVRWAQRTAPPGEFYLNSNEDREIIRYTTPRDIRLCLPMARTETTATKPAGNVPLNVTWEGTTAVLYPGNCLFFDARRVSVRPARPLPSGVSLHGTVETEQALR